MIDDLIIFLRARIAEDRATIAADQRHWSEVYDDLSGTDRLTRNADAATRAVDECERTINYEDYGHYLAGEVLKALALSYADHDEYQLSWKP